MRKLAFLGCAVLLGMQFTSCVPLYMLKGSYDGAKQKQAGQSPVQPATKTGGNVGFEFIWGLNGVGTKHIPLIDWDDDRVETENDPAEFRSADLLRDTAASTKTSGIFFSSSVEYVGKGLKGDGLTFSLNYLEANTDVMYGYRFSKNGLLFGGLGPYLAYGVGGNISDGMGKTSSFGSTGSFKRFDAGLNLEAGCLLHNGLEFTVGYDLGLVDVSGDPGDFTAFNRSFSINVGYSINKIIGAFKRH